MQVFSPYVEVLWKRMPAPLADIKAAGFDGVECHLIGGLRSPKRVNEVRNEAEQLGLGIRFHQGWSWQTGQRNLYNVVLRPLGVLVPVGESLAVQIRNVNGNPVVVYGNLAPEPSQLDCLYQTASEHVDGGPYTGKFVDFVHEVQSRRLPVVFDTQHVLEWFLDKTRVVGLPVNPEVIGQMVRELWQELGPFVKEIHLCDFNPLLGPTLGRNVFLGDGVFPLNEFCAEVRASGWDGVVTPEVAPQHLGGNQLRMLREEVHRLFC